MTLWGSKMMTKSDKRSMAAEAMSRAKILIHWPSVVNGSQAFRIGRQARISKSVQAVWKKRLVHIAAWHAQ